MNIGINATFRAQGGSLTNLLQLLNEWEKTGETENHDFVIYVGRTTEALLSPSGSWRVRFSRVPLADAGVPGRLMAEQLALPVLCRRDRIDVLFCPGNTMPLLMKQIPCVTTFQNAAPFCPSVTPSRAGAGLWIRLWLTGMFMRASAARSARIIFLSNYFRDLFVTRFRLPLNRAVHIYRARTDS